MGHVVKTLRELGPRCSPLQCEPHHHNCSPRKCAGCHLPLGLCSWSPPSSAVAQEWADRASAFLPGARSPGLPGPACLSGPSHWEDTPPNIRSLSHQLGWAWPWVRPHHGFHMPLCRAGHWLHGSSCHSPPVSSCRAQGRMQTRDSLGRVRQHSMGGHSGWQSDSTWS